MKYISLDLHAKDECIAIIKINRPEVLNALNKESMSELSTAIDIGDADNKIKVPIIVGFGGTWLNFQMNLHAELRQIIIV